MTASGRGLAVPDPAYWGQSQATFSSRIMGDLQRSLALR
jgi:hypothetical protein